MTTHAGARTVSPNRVIGAVFGAIYVLVGLVGFAITTSTAFAATSGPDLIIFEVNPLHNAAHIAIGAALAAAAYRGVKTSAMTNGVVGAAYLLLGVAGLFLVGSELNILALNHADNGLHFASAAVLLGAGLTRR